MAGAGHDLVQIKLPGTEQLRVRGGSPDECMQLQLQLMDTAV